MSKNELPRPLTVQEQEIIKRSDDVSARLKSTRAKLYAETSKYKGAIRLAETNARDTAYETMQRCDQELGELKEAIRLLEEEQKNADAAAIPLREIRAFFKLASSKEGRILIAQLDAEKSQELYDKIHQLLLVSGALVGGAVGYKLGLQHSAHTGISTALIGAGIFGNLGHVLGTVLLYVKSILDTR